MKHIELKMLTVQETGRLRVHKVSTHDNQADLMTKAMPPRKKTDQVRTSLEFARSILHRLEPTCTVTSVTPITETLSVEMNTVNSLQHQTQYYSQQKHIQLTAFSISILDVRHTEKETCERLQRQESTRRNHLPQTV